MSAYSRSNVFSDLYVTGNCIIGGTVTSLANPVNSLMTILQDQKANGSNGGGSSVGWQTRTLNTTVLDQIGVSLGSNQFTLPAGTYYVQISTPATQVNNHRCRLYNVTTSSTVLLGTSEIAQNGTPGNMTNRSFIDAYFTAAASGTYRVDHYCATAFANNGLGSNASSGDVEIFTTVKIFKINSGAALSQWTTGGSNLYYTTGNVGIGTTNPSGSGNSGSLLHIYDTTSANPTVHVDSSGGTGQARLHLRAGYGVSTHRAARIDFFNAITSGTIPQWTIISGYDQNGTNDMRVVNYAGTITTTWTQNGFVGIGTTNPGSIFTVNGNATVGFTTSAAPTNGLLVQGNVGIGTSSVTANVHVIGNVYASNAVQTTNLVTPTFTSNATNLVFQFDTLTMPYIVATSSVGIGTFDPKGPFHSYTTRLGFPDSSGSGTSNVVARIQSGSICLDFGSIGGTNPFWIQNHLDTAWNTTYPILLNPIGGNVGIGTTNPSVKLHVYNSTGAQIRIDGGSGGSGDPSIGFFVGATQRGIAAYSTAGTYMYFQNDTQDKMRFYNGAGGAISLQPVAGNVGIGTTTPNAKLQITGDSAGGTGYGVALIDYPNSASSGGCLCIRNSSGGTGAFASIVFETDASTATVSGNNSSPTAFNQGNGFIYSQNNGTGSSSKMGFQCWNGGTEYEYLALNWNSANGGQGVNIASCIWANPNSDSDARNYITNKDCNNPGTNADGRLNIQDRASIYVRFIGGNNGTVTLYGTITQSGASTLYNASSDYRLKSNIVPLTDGLTMINSLKPKTFTFNDYPDIVESGFIAHEVQEILPNCVHGAKDALSEDGSILPQGMDKSYIVTYLVAAVQQLSAKNADLEARLAALEAK